MMSRSLDRYEIARSMIAMARSPQMSPGWWLLAIAVTSGTNLLDFFAAAQPGAATSPAFAMAALLRVALVFWLSYALIRRFADERRPMALTAAFGRFVLFQIGMVILLGAVTGFAAKVLGLGGQGAAAGIVTFVLITGAYLLLVRLLAWQAALAIGYRELGPAGAWNALAGARGVLVTGYLLIAAFSAAHSALTRVALGSETAAALTGLALIDGVVSAVQLVLICALSVTAFRLALERGGALREGVAVA